MKNFLKWIGIGILAIIGFSFAIALSPLLLIGGGIAWFILRRKKSEKERFAKWITIAGVVGLAILMFMPASSTETDTAGVTEESTNMVKEPVTEPVENEDNETEQDGTEVQEETEQEAEDIEDDEGNDEDQTEELNYLDNGVVLVEDDREVLFSAESHLDNFSTRNVGALEDIHDQLNNGVLFTNNITLQDEYGNQTKRNVIAVYYSQETVDQINFENWPNLANTGLYETADTVFIHTILLTDANDFRQYLNHTEAPEFMHEIMGVEVE